MKIGRASLAGQISMPLRVQRDGSPAFVTASAEERGIDECASRWVKLGDKDIRGTIERAIISPGCGGEIEGIGAPCYIGVAPGVHGNACGDILTAASEEGRVVKAGIDDQSTAGVIIAI